MTVAGASFITWQHLDEATFNRVVEALLVRHHRDEADSRVYAVDGRGGDEGLDVVVERSGVVAHVYQLKFFPEGFSGGFRNSRRPQIKSSFERAIAEHAPGDWTLVVPTNGTLKERRYVSALRGTRQIRIHFMGQAELDGLLARYPEIAAWATRKPLLESLSVLREERAELAGSRDLGDRVAALATKADERSPYWGYHFASNERGVMQTLYAKRPDAAEKEPLELELTTQFGPDHGELREKFLSLLEWGSSEKLHLPPEVAVKVIQKGPEWFADEHAEVDLEIWSEPIGDLHMVELRVLSEGKRVLSSLRGEAAVSGRGTLGGTLRTTFRRCLTIDWRVPDEAGRGGAEVSFSMLRAETATDASAVSRFLRELRNGQTAELLVGGQRAFLSDLRSTLSIAPDDDIDALVDDLAFLERRLSVTITVPDEVTLGERVGVRIARMVLEGRCAIWPFTDTISGQLNGTLDDTVRMTLSGPSSMALAAEGFSIDFGGQSYEIGQVKLFHPCVEVEAGLDHLAALERGQGLGRTAEFRPADGTAFRIFSPEPWAERWQDPDRPLRPDPWGIPGVDEHEDLATILASS